MQKRGAAKMVRPRTFVSLGFPPEEVREGGISATRKLSAEAAENAAWVNVAVVYKISFWTGAAWLTSRGVQRWERGEAEATSFSKKEEKKKGVACASAPAPPALLVTSKSPRPERKKNIV